MQRAKALPSSTSPWHRVKFASRPSHTTPSLHVTASWNLDRFTCDTHLDDHLVEVWQISQRVLGPLFFD